jgi:hypothetical protein
MRTLVALVVLSLAVPAFAAEPAPPDPATVLAPSVAAAPSISLTVEQLQALVANAQAGVPMQPVKTAAISPDGILGVSWATLAGWLGGLGALVFGLLKGATALRVRRVLQDAIAGAWWVAERNFSDLDGTAKATAAMGALYEALAGQKIPLDPAIGAQAMSTWTAMSAKAGLAAPVILAPAAQPVPAADLASALARAAVATTPGSATDLADKAAR